ncbi:MAG: hypothetical protein AAFZ10_17095, partial [Pseudomonadota bacterium]
MVNPEPFKALYRALSLRNLNDALTSLNRQPIRAVWRCAAAYGLDSARCNSTVLEIEMAAYLRPQRCITS